MDASGWTSSELLYGALLSALGAPAWHGHNLDALSDSLTGGINAVSPPLTVSAADGLQAEMSLLLDRMAEIFRDARVEDGVEIYLNRK